MTKNSQNFIDKNQTFLIHGIFSEGNEQNPSSEALKRILEEGLKSKNVLGTGNPNHQDHNCIYFSILNNNFPKSNAIIIKPGEPESV